MQSYVLFFFQVTILNKNNYEWIYANEETKILYR